MDKAKIAALRDKKGNIVIKPVPSLQRVIQMKRKDLVLLLRHCPLNRFFGETRAVFSAKELTEAKLRIIAIDMIKEK